MSCSESMAVEDLAREDKPVAAPWVLRANGCMFVSAGEIWQGGAVGGRGENGDGKDKKNIHIIEISTHSCEN